MILPEKHLSIYESFIGFGGYLLKLLNKPLTVDTLWKKYIDEYEKKLYPVKSVSYTHLTLPTICSV